MEQLVRKLVIYKEGRLWEETEEEEVEGQTWKDKK
jgi:hypothetical protein